MRRVVALALLAAATLAGCGGGDDHDAQADRAYIDQVNGAVQRFAREAKELPSGFEADTLHTYSATLERTAADLRAIDPPDSVASLHRQLAGDVSTYAEAIDAAASAPLSKDPDKVVAAQQALLKATATVNRHVNRTLREIGRRLDAEQG
jgi:outer membrane murein-binding lipoprotein Lpp